MTSALSSALPISADGYLQTLMQYVISCTGLTYYSERHREFSTHVTARLEALQISDCRSYLQLLQSGADGNSELDRLITLLTIGETHFFRHRELFQAIERVILPNLIDKCRNERRLRIWSAGCSIGAEAYSISMILRRRFAAALSNWDIQIIGTDINREFLSRASTGQFENWALRAVSAEEQKACFVPLGNRWQVKPEYQQGVRFEYHNLASPQFSSPMKDLAQFDLILCRNVMIYFSPDVACQTINNLHRCLAPEGWLVVGHAEHNVDWFRGFRTQMSDGAVLYQNQGPLRGQTEVARENNGNHGIESPPANAPVQQPPVRPEAVTPWLTSGIQPTLRSSGDVRRHSSREKHSTLQEIRELADRGELNEALLRCQSLERSNSLESWVHLYQALILQQLGDDAGAERALKRALYLDRNSVLAHYYLGLLLQKQRHIARASHAFQNVLRLLAGRSPDEPIADADELSVADLSRLSTAHLEALQ